MRGGTREDGPAPAAAGHLLAHYVAPLRGRYSVNQAADGTWWHKIAWATPTGRVYLAVSDPTSSDPAVMLQPLCEQMEEVKRGLRSPSPDRFRAD